MALKGIGVETDGEHRGLTGGEVGFLGVGWQGGELGAPGAGAIRGHLLYLQLLRAGVDEGDLALQPRVGLDHSEIQHVGVGIQTGVQGDNRSQAEEQEPAGKPKV